MSSHLETGAVVFILNSAGATRQFLEELFGASGWRTEAYNSAREFLCRPHESVPSCLVLDAVLVDMCGFELQRRLAGTRPHLPILFVAAGAQVAAGVRAMKSGAVDFLTMPLDKGEVLRAVDEAIKRSSAALRHDAELRILSKSYASLSRREREVMTLVTSGLLNKQVGDRLGISETTVKAHRGRAMTKMNARSFADLVKKAQGLNLESNLSQGSGPFGSRTRSNPPRVDGFRDDKEGDWFTYSDWPARHGGTDAYARMT